MRTILVHFRDDMPTDSTIGKLTTLTVGSVADDDVEGVRALLTTAKRQAHELREQGYLARIDARWA